MIEIEVSRRLLDRMSIDAALGIPEVWRYDGGALRVSQLAPGGESRETGRSASFPMLPIPELGRFLADRGRLDETELVRSFRRWVRERFARG